MENQEIICLKCGAVNQVENIYCVKCASPLKEKLSINQSNDGHHPNKKVQKAWSIVLIILGAIIVVGVICFSIIQKDNNTVNSSKSISTANTVYKVNEVAKYKNTELSVTKIQKSNGTLIIKPKVGNEYVIVRLKIKNTGTDKLLINPNCFKLENSLRQTANAEFSTGINTDTALKSGDIASGGEADGTIVFEEPVNDSFLTLQYQSNVSSSQVNLQFKIS